MRTPTRRMTKSVVLCCTAGPGAIYVSGSTVTFEEETYFARNRATGYDGGGKTKLQQPQQPPLLRYK